MTRAFSGRLPLGDTGLFGHWRDLTNADRDELLARGARDNHLLARGPRLTMRAVHLRVRGRGRLGGILHGYEPAMTCANEVIGKGRATRECLEC